MSYTGIATLQVWVDDKPEPNLRLRVTAIDKRRAHKRVLNRAVAIEAARERFQPLTDALMRAVGLDTEPTVDQTGGMVMCLAISWPDDAYVWVSDYWWWRDDLILGLYDSPEHDGTYPEPPADLLDQLEQPWGDYKWPGEHPPQHVIDRIADWMAPLITAHGAAHGWESRASKGGQS